MIIYLSLPYIKSMRTSELTLNLHMLSEKNITLEFVVVFLGECVVQGYLASVGPR